MGLFNLFRSSPIEPISPFDAGDLGLLVWSKDDESWQGSYQGQTFFVFPAQPFTEPSTEVLVYAESILKDLGWLRSVIEDEKNKYLDQNPKFEAELRLLKVNSLNFSIHKRKGKYMNCQLGYGTPDRFWSMDFHDRKCSGMGFDT